jgi:NADH-quinone oxidoreductase subunit E
MKDTLQYPISDDLSAIVISEIDHEISHAPYRAAVAIDALKIVQKHHRWVSDERLQALADYLGMSAAELDGIATFYNLIYRKPVGKKVISLCNSVTCWIKGYDQLEGHLRQKLGVELGGMTKDGKYTLLPAPCLGACDKAPVMMLGDDLHENLSTPKLDEILTKDGVEE